MSNICTVRILFRKDRHKEREKERREHKVTINLALL